MAIAMFLAHLVGDYILQWDSLAIWKSKALSGALVHGALVTAVTLLFAWAIEPTWWPWALLIGAIHTLIDALWLYNRRLPPEYQLSPLPRFVIDQTLHFSVIIFALVASGYTAMPTLPSKVMVEVHNYRALAYVVGYVLISMPAWVTLEFFVYGVIRTPSSEFSPSANKYLGMIERSLITTFVLLGQFGLVPLVALPRLVFEGPKCFGNQKVTPYLAEVLASVAVAVAIGLALKALGQ